MRGTMAPRSDSAGLSPGQIRRRPAAELAGRRRRGENRPALSRRTSACRSVSRADEPRGTGGDGAPGRAMRPRRSSASMGEQACFGKLRHQRARHDDRVAAIIDALPGENLGDRSRDAARGACWRQPRCSIVSDKTCRTELSASEVVGCARSAAMPSSLKAGACSLAIKFGMVARHGYDTVGSHIKGHQCQIRLPRRRPGSSHATWSPRAAPRPRLRRRTDRRGQATPTGKIAAEADNVPGIWKRHRRRPASPSGAWRCSCCRCGLVVTIALAPIRAQGISETLGAPPQRRHRRAADASARSTPRTAKTCSRRCWEAGCR